MKVEFTRDCASDEMFAIELPDSQIGFYFIRKDDVGLLDQTIKEAVYVLMDRFRSIFYIGETGATKSGGVQHRFQVHKYQKDFWEYALVIVDIKGKFKRDDIRKWFEWKLNQIAKQSSQENSGKFKIVSTAGKQDDPPKMGQRIEDILAVCRFLGIPWGYAAGVAVESSGGMLQKSSAKESVALVRERGRASNFTFEMAKVPVGAELVFVEGGQRVRAAGKNQVVFNGVPYTLTKFTKEFMPPEKRNAKDAYQGPAYFTYKGELLTALRKRYEEGVG